ncbi:glycosyltransferase family 39 protein [soil metagenome]
MRLKASPIILLILMLLGGFLLRLYRLDNPIADWHSWRQADTSSVSRNFVTKGYDILHPRFDDLSNVPSGNDNPQGYRFVEFPLYNIAQAGLFQIIGIFTLEEWGRLISIFSSLITSVFLYLMVKKHWTQKAGLLTAFFYTFLPYSIYYGRTILPDTTMIMTTLGSIYFFDLWTESKPEIKNHQLSKTWGYFILAIVFAITALLLKPYAVFFLLPILTLCLQKYGWGFVRKWQLWVFALVSITPLILWRQWITQFPAGIPANNWLLNGDGIRFKPSFFRWIGYERVIKLISGYVGVIFLLIGSLTLLRKMNYFLLTFLLSTILYLCIFATGNVKHDYYQILIIPSMAIVYGIGAEQFVLLGKKRIPFSPSMGIAGLVTVTLITGTMFFFSWNIVKDYFNINNRSIVIAGEAIDKMTPRDAKVIAIYDGDTSFLYQTKRQGWASFEKPLDEMVNQLGADYLVLSNPVEKDLYFAKDYKILKQTKEYLLYDLHQKP